MSREEPYDPNSGDSLDRTQNEDLLPTISLICIPHATIPNLYQYCYEYVEPWQWSPGTELVETGCWFFEPAGDESKPHA